MKKISFMVILSIAIATLIVVSCKKDKKSDKNSPCSGFFSNNHPTDNFSASYVGSGSTFSTYFTENQSYKVTVESNGNITIKTNTSDIVFSGGTDITNCADEGHEYNIFYENKTSGLKLILQKEGSNYTLALQKIDFVFDDVATLKL